MKFAKLLDEELLDTEPFEEELRKAEPVTYVLDHESGRYFPDETIGAADRLFKALDVARAKRDADRADQEFLKSFRASHRRFLDRMARYTPIDLSAMVKSLKTDTAKTVAEMRQSAAREQHGLAVARLADFNTRFSASVRNGELSAEETAQIEARLNCHAQALDEIGKKLGVN